MHETLSTVVSPSALWLPPSGLALMADG